MRRRENTFQGELAYILGDLVEGFGEKLNHAREPLYVNSAVIAWWLQSMTAQNSVPSC